MQIDIKNKCSINPELIKECASKMLKTPSNWLVLFMTYVIWSLVGMPYSTNQNFDMVTAQQDYVMYLSLISIVVGLIHHQTKLINLAITGAVTITLSFITVAASKVGIVWLGYPIGYYLLCPITILLFLQQIKQICSFVCSSNCQLQACLSNQSDSNLATILKAEENKEAKPKLVKKTTKQSVKK